MKFLSRPKSLLGCAVTLALLQGCGGGNGGGGNPASTSTSSNSGAPTPTELPVAPSVNVGFGTKQLQFTWGAVAGATSYRVLEDANGSGTFTQIASNLNALTYSRDISVHTFDWINARYQVQACNDAGCVSSSTKSFSADDIVKAIGYFKASNTGSGDTFGWSISLSRDGSTLAVGAPTEDSSATGINGNGGDNGSADSGAVYIFTSTGSGWVQQAYIKASTVQAGANFGESVALSSDGNTLAIGAPFEDNNAGSAYVFTRSGTSWSASSRVKASNAYANSYFGWAVAINDAGDKLAVGAPGESNNSNSLTTNPHSVSNAGAVYTYANSAGTWANQIYLKSPSINTDDNFGASLALSGLGNVLAIGSPYKASAAGAVYVYNQAGSGWNAGSAISPSSGSAAGDNYGLVLALNSTGDTLAIGAPYRASNGANSGIAYVFTNNGTAWSQQAALKAANIETNDDFGTAVALSSDGNILAVGAIGESSAATGIDGNQADNSKDGVGAVYLFKRGNAAWAQQTYVKPSVSTLGDEFGTAIGMSRDGSTLAISGAFEQSKATGINGDQTDTTATDAGAVWLF